MGNQDGMLELTGLRRTYGEVVALDDLSFTVPPGQVFGFLGPNGAGKTTAMRAIVGVASLDSGTVRWNGEPIGARARSRIGYMPEERGLYLAMRVFEQLEYLARLHGMSATTAHAAARHWAERLGVGGRGEDKVEALSLGNQQRVQLAAALTGRRIALCSVAVHRCSVNLPTAAPMAQIVGWVSLTPSRHRTHCC